MKDRTIIGLIVLLSLGVISAIFIIGAQRRPNPANSDLTTINPAEITPVAVTASGAAQLFTILPAASSASFQLGELLRGQPTEVIGTTSDVSGELALDPSDLTTAQVGTITINATDLVTDNNFRNRAIRSYILLSDAYPTITFTPTAITGLPETAVPGQPLSFQITGQLIITIFSNEETFDVTAVLTADNRIEGSATTTIQRADYELTIPAAQGVAEVDETVTLTLNFVAEAAP